MRNNVHPCQSYFAIAKIINKKKTTKKPKPTTFLPLAPIKPTSYFKALKGT